MNANLLKYLLAERNQSQDSLAEALGLSRQSLWLRESGKISFKVDEIRIVKKFLNLSDQEVLDIFL